MKTISTIIAAPLLLTATFLFWTRATMAQTSKPHSQRQVSTDSLQQEDEQGIRKVVIGYEDAWNAHDMKALAKLFRDDAEFINVVGMHWRGRDAIVAAHAAFHETMFKDSRLKTDSIGIRPLGNSYAIAVVTITQDSFTTPGGQVMPKTQTKLSYVFAKGPDGWKIAHGQNVRMDAEAAKHDPVNGRRNSRASD